MFEKISKERLQNIINMHRETSIFVENLNDSIIKEVKQLYTMYCEKYKQKSAFFRWCVPVMSFDKFLEVTFRGVEHTSSFQLKLKRSCYMTDQVLNFLKIYNMEGTESEFEKLYKQMDILSAAQEINYYSIEKFQYLATPVNPNKHIIETISKIEQLYMTYTKKETITI